jgi:D-alanyl-D-alanine carboxypeptidase
MSLDSADGKRQMSVGMNPVRWNKLDSSGEPQHHPLDDALSAFYQETMCGNENAQAKTGSNDYH